MVNSTSAPTEKQIALRVVANMTGCGDIRQAYGQYHSVWKGGVKDGHDTQVEEHLAVMRALLRRLAWLEERGRCGG